MKRSTTTEARHGDLPRDGTPPGQLADRDRPVSADRDRHGRDPNMSVGCWRAPVHIGFSLPVTA